MTSPQLTRLLRAVSQSTFPCGHPRNRYLPSESVPGSTVKNRPLVVRLTGGPRYHERRRIRSRAHSQIAQAKRYVINLVDDRSSLEN